MAEHILELKDFRYSYGEIAAVKGISLHVDAGEIVALIGANGAGKTTTLRCVSGLIGAASGGAIYFMGQEITQKKPNEISSAGLIHVLEGRHIFPNLTVLENLMMGAYLRKDKKNIQLDIQRMYERFPRLEERKNQHAGTLSGGEQQMLAVARALMAKPKMILLDEPSMGLAPLVVKDIFQIIKDINEEGIPILLVEQNSKAALEIADRGYVLETGELVMQGSAEELLADDELIKRYLGG